VTQENRAILGACLALGLFALAMVAGLWAYFARVDTPWTWQSFVSTVSLLGAVGSMVLVWRLPERRTAGAGAGVLVFSLLRLGWFDAWTGGSFAVLALTVVLLVPLVHAMMVLPARS